MSTGNTVHKQLQRLEKFWGRSVRKGSLEEVMTWEMRSCHPGAVWEALGQALERDARETQASFPDFQKLKIKLKGQGSFL